MKRILFTSLAVVGVLILIFTFYSFDVDANAAVLGYIDTRSVTSAKIDYRKIYADREVSINSKTQLSSKFPMEVWFPMEGDNGNPIVETSPFNKRIDQAAFNYAPHFGVDLSCTNATGKRLYAMTDGMVTQAGTASGEGNYIRIMMKNGITFSYYHMNEPTNLSVGSQVKMGDIVGRVGNTGNSTGAHVHVEIWRPGLTSRPASIDNGEIDLFNEKYIKFKSESLPSGGVSHLQSDREKQGNVYGVEDN